MNLKEIYNIVLDKINKEHIKCLNNIQKPLFLISTAYPGVWLEHVYDSIIYAKLFNNYDIAENTIYAFIENQKPNGQLPCFIKEDGSIGYSQIQECVSFISLAYEVYKQTLNNVFLDNVYESSRKWIEWLFSNRMTMNKGLVEMFVGYDTGHDNSARLDGMNYKGYYSIDNVRCNASVLPNCDVAPIIAVDMNCNLYNNLRTMAIISKILKKDDQDYEQLAKEVKKSIFKYCFDEEDCYFYDVDKNGNKRKYLSSTIIHLFLEKVLDKEEDKELIKRIYNKYIKNEKHFFPNYPFPSMSISDSSWEKHKMPNSWGYYSQALIALRGSLWMDEYGYSSDYDIVLKKWVEGLVLNFDENPMGQELDPITGKSSGASTWYSSSMLLFIYAIKRLNLLK